MSLDDGRAWISGVVIFALGTTMSIYKIIVMYSLLIRGKLKTLEVVLIYI